MQVSVVGVYVRQDVHIVFTNSREKAQAWLLQSLNLHYFCMLQQSFEKEKFVWTEK